MTDPRRALPSVSALLERAEVRALLESTPRGLVVAAVRDVITGVRNQESATPDDDAGWAEAITMHLARVQQPSLRPAINATGIVLHTNLGRAPIAAVALEAIARVASGYSNLEYDAEAGARGSRYAHCATLLRELTGAEDALVVNNCAAALVLALNTLADGREAVLSRGELVEIGGSFRVHEIMAKSGARLREVGATNRTHVADYARALGRDSAAILKVHRSNFAVQGFVSEASVRDLAPIAFEHDLPIVHDLGSGLLIPLDDIGLTGEPTARQALAEGASVVVMSGDKLLGGPQAGIILGGARWLRAMRENPLARSYRVDKLTLAALEATLTLYHDPARAMREIPTLALLSASLDVLRARADRVVGALRGAGIECEIVESVSSVGAGAFPLAALPSLAVALSGDATNWSAGLRAGEPIVVGRVLDDRFLLDMRAVSERELAPLVTAVIDAHA
ncbi:MAG: L-seryl-tRNA(Sec) selenium transferase [Gemmatimonadaceae bacterium]